MKIEKKLHQSWVGPNPRPTKWMNTWPEKHPDWEYIIWDNEKVFSRKWKNQHLIDFYKKKEKWHGVADIIRYEILFEYGGFMPGADSECLMPIDELFDDDKELYAVRCGGEISDWQRADGIKDDEVPPFLVREDKRLIAPVYAAKKGNTFLENLIKELSLIPNENLDEPWKTTGNVFCANMLKKYEPEIVIWPMHYFIPYHPITIDAKTPYIYIGKDKIYAKHFWGTTHNNYNKGL
jgi:hypothetical protein